MRLAVIDLGTNSVRFDVHQIGPGNRVTLLHREKLMVRLGQGVFVEGKLDHDAMRRTLHAFQSFQRTAQDLQADKIVAFGTSALREAADSERLLSQIRTRTGIDVRVISGVEEAKLIALGVISYEKATKGKYALVDIGGGSVEISLCRGREVLHSDSFPLGTARLQQVFLKSSPPRAGTRGELSALDQLRRYIKSILLPKFISEEWPRAEKVIGSSGTVRALSRILNIKKKKNEKKGFDLKELKKLNERMSAMTTTQLLGIPGMEARRVDMILAGGILLEETMAALKAKRAFATEFALREGILEEEILTQRQNRRSHIAIHLEDLYARARKILPPDRLSHMTSVVALSETLFDRLKRLHKLKPEWRSYLTAAAILHDTGESISPTNHEQHSYYIVKNADFPSMQKWESEFVARLCLLHRGGKVNVEDAPFAKDKAKRLAFTRLLPILRVADSLDRGHKGNLRIREVRVTRKQVILKVSGRAGIDLELLRVEQKKDLFEKVFDRELVVTQIK